MKETTKKSLRIFLTLTIIAVVIGAIAYLYFGNENGRRNLNYATQAEFNNIDSYYDYLIENDEDKATYYTAKLYEVLFSNVEYFLEGNDLLYLSDYLSTNDLSGIDEYLTIALSGAMSGLFFDNPEYFFLSFLTMQVQVDYKDFTNEVDEVTISSVTGNFYSEEFSNAEQIRLALSRLEQTREAVYSQMTAGLNDYQIVVYLNDYLVDNVDYDLNYDNEYLAKDFIHTAYGALVNGDAVCDGYAYALKYLLDGLGIDNLVGAGFVESNGQEEGHMWSYVKLYGNWYGVDVTWNDPTDPFFWPMEENIHHQYLLLGGDYTLGTGFYANNRYIQNYIYYFEEGAEYYAFPVPVIEQVDFVFPVINQITPIENGDGSVTIILDATGLKDNYTFAYSYSSDGYSYGEYEVCGNNITFSNNENSGFYNFRLQTSDGQVIVSSDQTIEIVVETTQGSPEGSEVLSEEIYYLTKEEIGQESYA